jgi:D-lactate dehydrogenase
MKAVAYDIEPFEKEFLARANQKKHDITLIANPLSNDTVSYAAGKHAVIVFVNDGISASLLEKLAAMGVKYLVTCSAEHDAAEHAAALTNGIQVIKIPNYLFRKKTKEALQKIAEQTIDSLDFWQKNQHAGVLTQAINAKNLSSSKNKLN